MVNDNYATDTQIKQVFDGWFDPCALSDDRELRAFDGLGSEWGKKTFINPPYSDPLPWVKQAVREASFGKTIVMLLKHDSSTKWWALLQEQGALFLPVMGRLKHCTGKPANFPSVIAILKKGINAPLKEESDFLKKCQCPTCISIRKTQINASLKEESP